MDEWMIHGCFCFFSLFLFVEFHNTARTSSESSMATFPHRRTWNSPMCPAVWQPFPRCHWRDGCRSYWWPASLRLSSSRSESELAKWTRVPLLFHCCSIAVPLQRAIATCHCNVPLLFHCNVGWFGMSCCERRISPSAALLTASTGSPATSALATGAGRSRLLGRLGLVGLLLSTFAGGFPYNGIRNGTRPTFPYNSKFDTRHYIVIPHVIPLIWIHVYPHLKSCSYIN